MEAGGEKVQKIDRRYRKREEKEWEVKEYEPKVNNKFHIEMKRRI